MATLTLDQLKQLMTDLESESVERTRAFDKIDKMGQAICAFANDLPARGKPGYLLLGVENDGRPSGRRIDDDHLTSLGAMKTEGQLLPPPAMAIDVFHLEQGDVVVITVFPSLYPPIRYKGQIWVRVGARKALASEEDEHILEEKGRVAETRFEEMPCRGGAQLNELDLELFRNVYLPRAIQSEAIDDDIRSVSDQLASLRFYNRQYSTPTNLGMLLFGKHPELYIPSAYIQYVKFGSDSVTGDILIEHAYKGPLLKTVKQIDDFVKIGIAAPHSERISTLQEKISYAYPSWALRELILNAIIHRDYQIGNAPIKLYDYDGKRLEISNPGGLYGQANDDNFPNVNDYRNPLLAEAMKVMGYVNKFNRGVNKVKEEFEQNGNPPLVFECTSKSYFKVIAYRANNESGTIETTNGTIETTNGTIETTNGTIETTNGTIETTNGTIETTNGTIETTNGTIETTNGTIETTNGTIEAPNGTIEAPNGTIEAPNGTIENISNEQKILDAIKKHPGIKSAELTQVTEISRRTLYRVLARLSQEEPAPIEYRGSKRYGGWYVQEKQF